LSACATWATIFVSIWKEADMFTGIVEELGTVVSREGSRLRIAARAVLEGAGIGDSTAVNGCCLTIVAFDATEGWWDADVSDETWSRTNLESLVPGDPVNLERPVRLEDRLGGHLVQGHVDAVGEIVAPAPDLRVRMAPELLRYVVEKGSITVDGISLTVVAALADGFTVAVIPHTAEVTTLGTKGPGDAVNLEVDVIAKYTERLLEGQLAALATGSSATTTRTTAPSEEAR
jgi:riboflavin synthase